MTTTVKVSELSEIDFPIPRIIFMDRQNSECEVNKKINFQYYYSLTLTARVNAESVHMSKFIRASMCVLYIFCVYRLSISGETCARIYFKRGLLKKKNIYDFLYTRTFVSQCGRLSYCSKLTPTVTR